jgi:hypothetical protein
MPALLSRVAGAGGLLVLVLGLTAAQSGHLSGRPAEAGSAAAPSAVDPGIRNYLYGVAALSASDAWAAGYYCTGHCGAAAETDRTLIAHWNGTTWAQVPSPSPGTTVSRLSSVSADSATDVWAAGYYCASQCGQAAEIDRTLIAHWNGTTWAQVPSPSVPSTVSRFYSVSADSATDAWAAGTDCFSPCAGTAVHHTLTAHWDGTTWSLITGPGPGAGSDLAGVSADSATDAWAAGTYCLAACGTSSEADHTLAAHWDGTAWSVVSSPNPSPSPVPEAVSADSATDAWVVGWYNTASASKALILHWNGTAWTRTSGPSPGSLLRGVSAASPADAWAAGQVFATATGKFATVTLHWNGTAWARVPSPSPGSLSNNLFAVGADAPADAWAVGYYCASQCAENSEHDDTLILHWNGTAWSRA